MNQNALKFAARLAVLPGTSFEDARIEQNQALCDRSRGVMLAQIAAHFDAHRTTR